MFTIDDYLQFGVVYLGLSPAEFWELSWFEWGLYLLRYEHQQEKELMEFENSWHQSRIIMSLLHNANFKPKKKLTDFIKLSFDIEAEKKKVSKPLSPSEVADRFNLKKNKSNGK